IITGDGVIGMLAVSGLPQVDDHKMAIKGLLNFKQAKSLKVD
ncbi:MAG: hypothetical protein RLY38_763, partial [Actinomycetota bacterium]